MPELLKMCSLCRVSFPATLEFFYKDSTGTHGLQGRCKPCGRASHKIYSQLRKSGAPVKTRRAVATAEQEKTCTKCKDVFPATLDFFYRNAGGKFGVTPRCKACVNVDNEESHQRRLAADPVKVRAQASARSIRNYHRDIEVGRKRARDSAARARLDPVKRERINVRKRTSYYGMTAEDLEALFEAQGHRCAICGTDEPGGSTTWNIDHCHASGKVRFILCCHCNRGLGAFRDNPTWLRKAGIPPVGAAWA